MTKSQAIEMMRSHSEGQISERGASLSTLPILSTPFSIFTPFPMVFITKINFLSIYSNFHYNSTYTASHNEQRP